MKVGLQYNYAWNDFYQGGSANGVFTFQTDLPFDAANPSTYPERLQIRVPNVSNIKPANRAYWRTNREFMENNLLVMWPPPQL